MEKQANLLKTLALVALGVGIACLVLGGLAGYWMVSEAVELADSLPPPPEGPPDAGAYGMLAGLLTLIITAVVSLTLFVIAGILALIRRQRRRAASS